MPGSPFGPWIPGSPVAPRSPLGRFVRARLVVLAGQAHPQDLSAPVARQSPVVRALRLCRAARVHRTGIRLACTLQRRLLQTLRWSWSPPNHASMELLRQTRELSTADSTRRRLLAYPVAARRDLIGVIAGKPARCIAEEILSEILTTNSAISTCWLRTVIRNFRSQTMSRRCRCRQQRTLPARPWHPRLGHLQKEAADA